MATNRCDQLAGLPFVMARSVANASRPAEVQTLDLPLVGAVPDRPATVQPFDDSSTVPLLDCLAGAIDATTKREAAAAQMAMDHSQMTRQLQGDGHFSLKRASRLDRDTLLDFANRIRQHCGVQDDPKEAATRDAQQISAALFRIVARVR